MVAELNTRAIDIEICRENLVQQLDYELEKAAHQVGFRLDMTLQASETEKLSVEVYRSLASISKI
jgi:hypothetical protein